ncbi:MAG: VOC family protein [Thermomicrobiales bacterium]|nr:VOC family protein [Thermomicrobiales bacterium]
MASNSIYLNFTGNAEEAFNFYKSVFGTEFASGIMRHGDVPVMEGMPPLDDAAKQMIMNVQLPITGGLVLMGSDIPASWGMPITAGNNFSIGVHTDTRAEADALYAALSAGGTAQDTMQEQFWGDYYGNLTDKFGIQWYVVTSSKA